MRRLPEAYSLALRLQRAGVADEVICSYLRIEPEGLGTLVILAKAKLAAQLVELDCQEPTPRRRASPGRAGGGDEDDE